MPRALLLHGFTGAPSSFDTFVEALGSGWRTLRPFLPGHGLHRSAGAANTYFGAVADFQAELADELNVTSERWHLLGYSLGARVALGLLRLAPAHFASATLVGVHPGLCCESERQERRQRDEKWCVHLECNGVESFASDWEQQALFLTQTRLAPAALLAQATRRRAHQAAGLAWALRTLGLGQMPNHRAFLRSPPLPIQLIAGELDVKFCRLARALAEYSDGCHFIPIAGAGHNVVLERPATLAKVFIEGAVDD